MSDILIFERDCVHHKRGDLISEGTYALPLMHSLLDNGICRNFFQNSLESLPYLIVHSSSDKLKAVAISLIAGCITDNSAQSWATLAGEAWGEPWTWQIYYEIYTQRQQIIDAYNHKLNRATRSSRTRETATTYQDSPLMRQIKAKISIRDVLVHYGIEVQGKMACCPFHEDHNPSLSIDETRGLWYCHGCHKGGNMLTFVKEMQKKRSVA